MEKTSHHKGKDEADSASSNAPQVLRDIVRHNARTPLAVVQHLRFLEANAAFADILGISDPAELRGESLSKFFSAAALTTVAESLERWGNKRDGPCTCYVTGGDGVAVPIDLHTLRWPANSSVVLMIADDTEHRLGAGNKITDRDRLLEPQLDLITGVSHELRAPLTGIIGYARLLLDEVAGPLSPDQKAAVEKIISFSGELLALAEDMLRTAEKKRGAAAIHPRWCKPWRVIKNSYAYLKPQADEKGVQILFRTSISAIRGIYDREKLRAIVNSLIANAIRCTEAGVIELTVDCSREGVEVTVLDTGHGLTEDELLHIFDGDAEPLEHDYGDSPQDASSLDVVADLVNYTEASVVVSSAAGVGSAFTLYMPAMSGSDAWPMVRDRKTDASGSRG